MHEQIDFPCFRNLFSSISCALLKTLIEPKSQSMYLLSAETEVWELETGNNKIISPTLPDGKYLSEIGIYAVDFNFCSK